jgi:hypothetical protein
MLLLVVLMAWAKADATAGAVSETTASVWRSLYLAMAALISVGVATLFLKVNQSQSSK